jgi:ATP-dependent DNA helicase RecG
VATTVIEVGIDVPNATVMIIEHAERFGLAQLHQLRGRVGRGGAQSHCILVASNKLKRRESYLETSQQAEERSVALERLEKMVETTDGFKIAEADLEMRGPGEFFGTKQSGLPVFQIADLVKDVDIMEIAREDAQRIVASDPHLRSAENSMTRTAFLGRYQGAESFMQVG